MTSLLLSKLCNSLLHNFDSFCQKWQKVSLVTAKEIMNKNFEIISLKHNISLSFVFSNLSLSLSFSSLPLSDLCLHTLLLEDLSAASALIVDADPPNGFWPPQANAAIGETRGST